MGFIDGSVCDSRAGSYGGLQEKSFSEHLKFLTILVFHCRHKMKYSCYQDSSFIRSWFVWLVWFEEFFATE